MYLSLQMRRIRSTAVNTVKRNTAAEDKYRFPRTDKVSAGRQVLLTHTFSLGRSVTVHKSAKDTL